MSWLDYIVNIAAPHSKYDALHWFRYLRKDINRNISEEQLNFLYNDKRLTAFQRVSLKAAFTENSPTRKYILGLNSKVIPNKLQLLREKYDNKL